MDVRRLALIALMVVGCAELPDIVADGQCGNGVIEPASGEDCEPGVGQAEGLMCGAANTVNRCRFICGDADPSAVCPPGWGCGSGVCRAPSGTFGARRTINSLAGSIAVGDVDGDGHPDLVNVAEPFLTVAFGDGEGAFETLVTVPIDSSPEKPVLADIEPKRDGERATQDVIVYAGARVNVYRGRPDQELDPVAVPEGVLPARISEVAVLAMRSGDRSQRQIPIILGSDGDVAEFSAAGLGTLVGDVQRALDGGDDFPRRLAVAELDPGAAEPDDEVAWGVVGGATVYVDGLVCAWSDMPPTVETCEIERRGEVTLPGGATLGPAGTFLGDVDGDGVLDLVADVGGGRIALAMGAAVDGRFDGFGAPTTLGWPMRNDLPAGAGASGPLELADLGRGQAELITSSGSYAFAMMPGGRIDFAPGSLRPPSRQVEDARAVDFNRDGQVDVLVRSGESIILYLNAGADAFNPIETQAGDNLVDMRVGDFDGDLQLDVLAVSRDALAVGFADANGIPRTYTPVAEEEDGYVAVEVVRLADASGEAADDVVAIKEGESGLQRLTMRGSGVQRLTAPLTVEFQISGLAVLERDGRPTQVAAAVQLERGRAFVVVDWDDLALGPPADGTPGVGYTGCDFDGTAIMRGVDLDGDANDEMLLVPNGGMGMAPPTTWRPWVVTGLDTACDGDRGDCVMREADCTRLEPAVVDGAAVSAPDEVLTADLDGDGHPDLLVTHHGRPTDGEPGEPGEEGEGGDTSDLFAIWWGSEAGLGATPSLFASAFISDEFNGPIGAIELDGTPGLELIVAARDTFYAFDIADRRLSDAPTAIEIGGVEAGEVRAIDVTDVDGDGVDDVVLSGAERVAIVRQTVCTAEGAFEQSCQRRVPGR